MTLRLLVAVAVLAAAGCTVAYPPPAGGRRGLAHEAPHVALLGDSITWQMMHTYGPGAGAPADLETFAGWGWHAGTPALPLAVRNEAATDDLDLLVIALGVNDSADGWTQADVDAWAALLAPVGPDVCIRVVLPAWSARGLTRERSGHLLATRAGIVAAMGTRPAVSYVDWQDTLDRLGPGLLAPDGIHLANDPTTGIAHPAAAAARADTLWSGVDRCGALIGRAA